MHGTNLSVIPELENGAPLLSADQSLGGMRNLLPLSGSSMFGAGKNPLQLRNLMRKLSARISREPNWPTEENPNIPSGYTYLLQFIAHDIVNTSISLAATDGRRFGFQNARQQPLTLDTIFGGGPDVSPQAYEFSRVCKESRGLMPRTRLRCGRAQDRSGSTAGMPFADIGRAEPVDVNDDGINVRQDSAQCPLTEALVADARNEDQALITQITVLFHRLHNYILDQIEASRRSVTAADAYRNFICARFVLTLIYRRIILQDVLYRLLDPSVIRYYLVEKRSLVADDKSGRIPVEFAHGAFRCGHAMVRNSYRVRSEDALETGRAMQFNSRRSPGFVPLTEQWIIKWERFFEISRQTPPNYSRRLGPSFSPIVRSEFFFPPLNPNVDGNGDAAGLPNRDLVSAVYARIWSVPKLIDALRAKSPELSNFLPAYDEHVSRLKNWLELTADPNGISEQFDPDDVSALVADPPLPFFILFEAALKHAGQRLGPLGSIIVAETIIAAMESNPLRVEKLAFYPQRQIKEQSELLKRLGITDTALSKMPEIESMEELLMFMQSEGILGD
jgi:hypothetical protein